MIISTMQKSPKRDYIPGACANCQKAVFESLSMLDDAYNVWGGKCPYCDAINMLAMTSLRGYSSAGMDLVLPHDEEVEANGLPTGCPTSGPGGPTKPGGTVSGQICHELRHGDDGEEGRDAV